LLNTDIFLLTFRSCNRTPDDLALIYEELLHIKALHHLSTTVSDLIWLEFDRLLSGGRG